MILEKDSQLQVEEQWLAAADEMLVWGWSVEEQASHHGLLIARTVLKAEDIHQQKQASDDVRQDTYRANVADRRLVALCGGDLDVFEGSDRAQAYGIRLWHHSGKIALKLIGSETKRDRTHRVLQELNRQIYRGQSQGMGGLGWHDISADLVLSRIKRR